MRMCQILCASPTCLVGLRRSLVRPCTHKSVGLTDVRSHPNSGAKADNSRTESTRASMEALPPIVRTQHLTVRSSSSSCQALVPVEHRLDRGPFIVDEFIAHDSKPQFESHASGQTQRFWPGPGTGALGARGTSDGRQSPQTRSKMNPARSGVLVITFYSCLSPLPARQAPSHRQGRRDALENRTGRP